MKKFFLTLLMIAALFAPMHMAVAAEPAQHVLVQVKGLHCEDCAQSVVHELKKISSVRDVKVDVEGGTVDIVLKKERTIDNEAIRNAVKDAGFKVKKIER